jgi:predicted metal-dependent hydrolase
MKENILLGLIIIFVYIFIYFNKNNFIYVESNTGVSYLVQKSDNKQEKANLLDKLMKNLFLLKNHLVDNINKYPDIAQYIEQLNRNFNENRTAVYETDPKTKLTSYSVNKGEELSFCLTSKKTNDLHDVNLLMYVAIHELSHIACPEIGHGALFKKIFKKFIDVSIELNIYNKVDYNQYPVEYCGMNLNSSI